MLQAMKKIPQFDVLIVGGGATGLGAAVDAASRGFKTLLLEQHDFAKGTSSRSTKLVHGGLRYLKQGNIGLVTEALKERGLLCKNAPHLIGHLAFLVPNYHWWEGPFYGIGLKIYDMLAGELGIEKSLNLSKEETIKRIPNLLQEGLRGGKIYYDGQFDDSRLAITLAQSASDLEGIVLNYVKVTDLIKENGLVAGVKAVDELSNETFEIRSKTVINATGIFTDHLRQIDDPSVKKIIAQSQGVHLVFDRSFLMSDTSIMVPHTEDGRVLFIVPWHNHILVGTTDTEIPEPLLEPKPLKEEVEFLLHHAGKYLEKTPKKEDILSMFAGIRPLVKPDKDESTSAISRDHTIIVSESKLISISGGKWTTYRKMAEDVIDKTIEVGDLEKVSCSTESLHLHGYLENVETVDSWSTYGEDAKFLAELAQQNPHLDKPLHPDLSYLVVEVLWAVREEMAQKLEDVLARRTRALFLNVKASLEIAPYVAEIMKNELGKNDDWKEKELSEFRTLANSYLFDF